jgi:ribosomal protein L40E
MDKDQLIILLLIIMAVVLAIELAYILIRKKRRKAEMSLFKKQSEPVETMADKAHNAVLTTESISSTLSRQGIDTSDADSMLREAKRSLSMRDYTTAMERADAAKLVLLRLRREHESKAPAPAQPHPDPGKRPMDRSYNEPREEKSLDALPTNYIQSKFMLATTKDLIEKREIRSGEAYDFYKNAVAAYEREDYTKALSLAIKAEKLLGSGTLTLIGEEKHIEASEEVIEVMVCPSCDKEVSEDDSFCRECGQNLESARGCPGCGAETTAADKFCRKCGTKLR